MDIGTIIQQSLVSNANSPLFIERNLDETRTITYADAQTLFNRYLQWTSDLIQHVYTQLQSADTGHSSPSTCSHPVLAFLGNNSPDYLLAVLACIHTGHTTSLLNVRWTPLEIANTLRVPCSCAQSYNDSYPQVRLITIIIYANEMKDVATQAMTQLSSSPCGKHVAFTLPLPYFCHELGRILHHTPTPVKSIYPSNGLDYCNIKPDQVTDRDAIILFTSGTSSSHGSKGCCLSHRSLFTQAFAKTCYPCGYSRESKLYANPLPFFHVGGFSSALAILLAGGSFVFSPSAKEVTTTFQPFMMVQSISSKNDTQCHSLANTLAVVPAMLHSLFAHLQDSTNTFSGVQLILVGGQSLSDSQWDKCHRYFPNARIVQTYACTEAGSSITFADVSQVRQSGGTLGGAFVGYPPPHIDIEIIDPDSVRNGPLEWTILPCLQMGLIVTKGPHVMNHYWCRKDLTSPDSNHGWLVMNDLGYLTDQGCLYYCGRSDDVIRTGGESVLAMEVERVLIHHPMIDAVCVFPLQDEKFGQIVCAAIQPKQGVCFASDSRRINQMASMSSDALEKVRTFCSNHQLARYKHPKKVFIFHQLPQNSSGKILKFAIIKLCSESDTIYHSKL